MTQMLITTNCKFRRESMAAISESVLQILLLGKEMKRRVNLKMKLDADDSLFNRINKASD